MSSSSSFTGIGLTLQSVSPLAGNASLRVRFTNDPLAANAAGVHDALNPANYALSGSVALAVVGALSVPDDPQSIDVLLSGALVTGSWTLAASNITTALGDVLTAPTSLTFDVTVVATAEPVSMGAKNDSAEGVIRKHLNPSMAGRFWSGIIAALAVGDRINWDNARAAFDQLFISSASGVYLDRKTADNGLSRPAAVGMGDDLYRRFSIKITANKLTAHVLNEILEVFYGQDAVRAHATSAVGETFQIADGDSFSILFDEKDLVQVVFKSTDFANASKATAVEIAAVITRFCRAQGLKAYAVAFSDPETGLKKIRVYTASLGLVGSVRVTGGKAQNVLKFETLLTGVVPTETWDITVPRAGVMRLTHTGPTTVDLNLVREGDYVNVFGTNFNVLNRGSFPIVKTNVHYEASTLVQYVELMHSEAVAQASVLIASANDILFFRPTRQNINGPRAVIVSQPTSDRLDVVLPATTQAVERTVRQAAYIQQRPSIAVSSLERINGLVNITTTAAHGLAAGEWIDLDGVVPDRAPPATVAGNGTTTSDASYVSIWSSLANLPGAATTDCAGITLNDGSFFVVGGSNAGTPSALARKLTVSGISGSGNKRLTYAWAAKTAMPAACIGPRLTVLQDTNQLGNVLVTGGDNGGAQSAAYIYKPGIDNWFGPFLMTVARKNHAQVLLNDNTILVAGGTGLSSTSIYTPNAGLGVFVAKASMSLPRGNFALVKLSTGKVVAIGGDVGTNQSTAQCEVYDPATNTWAATGSMSFARRSHCTVLLPNDQILVIGGLGGPATRPTVNAAIADAEIYDGRTGTWHRAGRTSVARSYAGAVLLTDKVLVFGGANTTDAEYFDVATRTWTRAPHSMPVVRSRFAFGTAAGFAVFAGGEDSGAVASASTGVFIRNSDTIGTGKLAGRYQLAVAAGTSLQFSTTDTSYLKAINSPTVTPATSKPSTVPGPYLLDPYEGISVSGTVTTMTQSINQNGQYATLKVADAAKFPDAIGYVAIAFGSKLQIAPVKYLGRLSATELLLDYSFKFPLSVGTGATVTLLNGKGAYNPADAKDIGAFYLTAASAGRVAAENAIDSAIAAGFTVDKTIRYPGDRGLGGEGLPVEGTPKLSDKVTVWGGDELDAEVAAARAGEN